MPGSESRPRVNYYLAWARTYLKRGGALENSSRSVWSLTDMGDEITDLKQTKLLYDKVNAEERERAKLKKAETKSSAKNETNQLEDKATQESWKTRLLATMGNMAPDAFERLAQRLLRGSGFIKVEVRGKSGDGGIDGVGVLRVNLVSFQVYFQCKRWKGSVGSKEIRDFRGALQGRADKGLFITTGHFSSQASDEATRDGAIAIDLIDGERLCDLLKQNNLGVTTRMIEQVEINRQWFHQL